MLSLIKVKFLTSPHGPVECEMSVAVGRYPSRSVGRLSVADMRDGGGGSRSPSPPPGPRTAAPGYEQYQKSLLEVPWPPAEYGEASSDDLSSEWDSDVQDLPSVSKVGHVCFSFRTQFVSVKLFYSRFI